jgi:pyroglutamyl-peptidase
MNTRAAAILITGFEPFAGASINPSAELARQLDGNSIGACRVHGVVLPCVFGAAAHELKQALRRVNPRLVLCLGQASGRAQITPERIAINVDDASIPDNAGQQPVDQPIIKGGPAALWSSLPLKAIVAELERHDIPAAVSASAGTYVCNHVFYVLMHALRRRPGIRGGFIHLPLLPEQAGVNQPSLPLVTMRQALVLAAELVLSGRSA